MIKITERGFGITIFEDAYGHQCSLQKSSTVIPHIWLGVDDANPKIMASKTPQGGTGWIDYTIPSDVSLYTRMHLDVEQVKWLIEQLQEFLSEVTHE